MVRNDNKCITIKMSDALRIAEMIRTMPKRSKREMKRSYDRAMKAVEMMKLYNDKTNE